MMDKIKLVFLKIHSLIVSLKYKVTLGKGSRIQAGCIIKGGKYITIGKDSFIGKDTWLVCYDNYLNERYQPTIRIGNGTSIGQYSCLTAIHSIQIADGCLISQHFYTSDHSHGFNPKLGISPANQKLESKGPIVIGENCFIGYRVTVLPNVTIGKNCVIGSHSVVTKNIPDYSMATGVPARVIKKFDFQLNEWVKITN